MSYPSVRGTTTNRGVGRHIVSAQYPPPSPSSCSSSYAYASPPTVVAAARSVPPSSHQHPSLLSCDYNCQGDLWRTPSSQVSLF
ncbi:hypothetical protein M0804_014448 [Polistes exclamans]|nr:hypothetical protein M0804_014453 [Polistes exclamans]KAI4475206.1 hypothetical protein M0804_014448 [Polistes exclamans]